MPSSCHRKFFYLINVRVDISKSIRLVTYFRNHKKKTLFTLREEIKEYTFSPFETTDEDDKLEALRNCKVIVTVGENDSPIFIEESRRYNRVSGIIILFKLIFSSIQLFSL